MEQWLNKIILQIGDLYGVDISKFENGFLLNSIEKRIISNKCTGYNNYSELLLNDANEAEAFFNSLNINYSEFFRNKLTFSYLEQVLLPGIISQKLARKEKELRIWSAACSNGQEPYSLAILCEELTFKLKDRLQYRIIATDINERDVNSAKSGVFTPLSMGNVSLNYLQKYFLIKGENYQVSSEIRERVDFSVFNLLDGDEYCPPVSIFGNFDIVMCCNILYYYKQDCRKSIINRLSRSFSKETYLITGETERSFLKESDFREVASHTGIFRQSNIII